MEKRRVHFVLSTHWDREWHHTFQDFRYRLVRVIDELIAGWEDGSLKGPFQTDGQAIILEDYLEVRPERREQIQKLAREGKLAIGPWYVLPDEFNVSGEALIRNLRLGREIARSFGVEPSGAGFLCDMFGHISQMPQIFAGFHVPGAFIWRGTNTCDERNVLWQGADGTTLPCLRFGPVGYCDYAIQVRHANDPRETKYDPEVFWERLETYLETEARASQVDAILAFDGGDHLGWDREGYRLLLEYFEKLPHHESERGTAFAFAHTTLDAYLADLSAQQDRIETVLQGELREPGLAVRRPDQDPMVTDQQWVIPGVLSSRVNLKQANSACQALLCQWAEPLGAMAQAFTGMEYPQGYLNIAWRWLLQNHPHDSIDGCSIDQVHRDMQYRFDQARQIGERLALEATTQMALAAAGEPGEKELRAAVFNPLPRPVEEVVELALQIPTDWPAFNEFFGYEPKPAFRIYGPQGAEIPYQRTGQAMGQRRWRMFASRFPEIVPYHEVKVALRLALPALGYTTLTVRAGYPGEVTRHPQAPGLAISENAMANERLQVEVAENGSLTLTDLRSGQVYHRLLTFEDTADIGDGWYHGQAVNDQNFVSTASRAEAALVCNGPLAAAFRVRTVMNVPAEFDFAAMRRSEHFIPLVIDSTVTLRQGQDFVEVKTVVENQAGDHRLRVLLPSGAQTDTHLADSAFDVVERFIPLRADNHLYRELEVETRPQQSWTAVFDRERGLAVVGAGLLECAVRDLPERPLALTLFRATRRTVGTNGEPDGQMKGRLEFHYLIAPLEGEPDRTRLIELGQRLAARLRVAQARREDFVNRRTAATLPAQAGFLKLSGPAVLTSLRQASGALEARLFNPTEQAIEARLSFEDWPAEARRPTTMQPVDFESNPAGEARPANEVIGLKAKQIVTLKLT